MAIYRYDSGSLLDEVRLIKNSAGGVRALLHARTDASPEQLSSIQQHLIQQGLKAVPIFEEGKHYLEVRGIKEKPFFSLIMQKNWVHGTPAISHPAGDEQSASDKRKNMTLMGSGIAYHAGDIGYMVYASNALKHEKSLPDGEIAGAKLNIVAGIGYALGSIVLTFFASRDQSSRQIKEATRKVQSFLYRSDVHATEADSIFQITKRDEHKSLGHRLKEFLNHYPSEITNLIFMVTGMFLAASSYKGATGPRKISETLSDFKNRKLTDTIDVGLGALTTLSGMTAILVKEKKPMEGEKKRAGIGKFFDWIQEKPLRAAGYGYMASTAVHTVATVLKYTKGDEFTRKNVVWRGVFILSNVVAEILMAISSKGHGQGVKADKSIDSTVIASAAELLAKHPQEKQETLIHQLAGHMASPEILGGKADAIAAELRTQVASMKSNPWAAHKLPASAPVMVAEAAPEQPHEEKPSTKVSHVEHASHQKHQVSHAHHDVEHKAESSHTEQGDSWQDHAQHTKQHAHTAAASV